MNRLSKFVGRIEWILASPASDSVDGDIEFYVSRAAVKQVKGLCRTYVLINLSAPKKLSDKNGSEKHYSSVIYRQDLSIASSLTRISSITFFAEHFAKGDISCSFFYYHEPWSDDKQGFEIPLIQFMLNHNP